MQYVKGLYKNFILNLTVFACGALVMVFEIIGSRILSPFIGTSTYIWTSLIGVILASLSLGYWLGGRLADDKPKVGILASVIFAAGGLVSLTVLVKDILLSIIASAAMPLEMKALMAALVLFAPASVCLGFVTPFAVRLRMTSLADTGKTVGSLYALSTIGSILGTFAAGFFLIPFVGSVRTLYLIAAGLMLIGLLLVPIAFSKIKIASVLVFILGVTASEANSFLLRQQSGLHDIDTEYSRVQVFRTLDPKTNRPIQALATDPYFVQSAAFLDSDELVLDYSRYYHLIRHFNPDFDRTLLIGGAGYSFPKTYLRTYETAKIDVVEIDSNMTEIARSFFRLNDDPRMHILHEDGRMFLNRAETATYDAVLMDAFGSLFSVPTHLTTVEAVTQMHRILNDDGLVIFNLGSAITGEGSGFLHAEFNTYRQVFPRVFLFKVNADYADERIQNLIIVATKSTTDLPTQPSSDQIISSLLANRREFQIEPAAILTDDLAPVEHYNSIAQNLYLMKKE